MSSPITPDIEAGSPNSSVSNKVISPESGNSNSNNLNSNNYNRFSRLSHLNEFHYNDEEKKSWAVSNIPTTIRNHLISCISEFCGTFIFLFFAFGIANVANANFDAFNDSPNTRIVLISLGFGFGVCVGVFIFYRISGGHLNPCVSLGLYLVGAINFTRFIINSISQLLAGMAAAGAVNAMTPGPVRFINTLGAGYNRTQGLFLEMFFTATLVATVLFNAVEKSRVTYLAPLSIGLALFIGHLFGVPTTGAGINPARSLGPCVAGHFFPHYHWIYWVGPILGSFLAAGLWHLLKFLNYQTANPGQDDDGLEEKRK